MAWAVHGVRAAWHERQPLHGPGLAARHVRCAPWPPLNTLAHLGACEHTGGWFRFPSRRWEPGCARYPSVHVSWGPNHRSLHRIAPDRPAPPPPPPFAGPVAWEAPAVKAPAWTKDLVIYEIAPRGFTSPSGVGTRGAGSGTFQVAPVARRRRRTRRTCALQPPPLCGAQQLPPSPMLRAGQKVPDFVHEESAPICRF